MATGLLVALTVLSLAGAGVVGMTMAAPHASSGMQSSNGGGMMNGGYSGGMMGGGGACRYQGNYQSCQQYMDQNNVTNRDCPMMG